MSTFLSSGVAISYFLKLSLWGDLNTRYIKFPAAIQSVNFSLSQFLLCGSKIKEHSFSEVCIKLIEEDGLLY